jgi:hypothetical protein|tara:strand:+ start:420 stop:692 length:273 start_codon:yes stop_codon:yes gene_type:complete
MSTPNQTPTTANISLFNTNGPPELIGVKVAALEVLAKRGQVDGTLDQIDDAKQLLWRRAQTYQGNDLMEFDRGMATLVVTDAYHQYGFPQ